MAKKSPFEKLEKKFEAYQDFAYSLAENVFNAEVSPMLNKYNIQLFTGMGSWSLRKTLPSGKTVSLDWWILEKSKLWGPLVELLRTEIPGLPVSDLGSLMPSYKPGEK